MARTQSEGNIPDSHTIIIPETPIGLSIAGSDCSAGAGIQADLKTFTALGVYGLTVVTAVVAETPHHVVEIQAMSDALVASQLDVLLQTYPIAAAKTGMLPSTEQIIRLADLLGSWKKRFPAARLVVDPVIIASSGKSLITDEALATMQEMLLPLADLITPNQLESETLLGQQIWDSSDTVRALADKFQTAVLLKGGHSDDPTTATDLLWTVDGLTEYSTPRIPNGHHLHGTGCTLSAAITACLAKGHRLENAVAEAKDYLTRCMEQALHWGDVSALGTSNR
ncbi:MAG: hydroxymethylpyrimidine/phosphomethylpyrimidine kinase [Verrucomicrobiales bacterium]|jgi:hydroxymethylpyrimidine/phosphomethylpyrimidine kinase